MKWSNRAAVVPVHSVIADGQFRSSTGAAETIGRVTPHGVMRSADSDLIVLIGL